MKLRKAAVVMLAGAMTLSLAACGSGSGSTANKSSSKRESFLDIRVGTTGKDLKGTVRFLTNRTDMMKKDFNGKTWDQYVADFNKEYPDIRIEVKGLANYDDDAAKRLQDSDWGDVMMIPSSVLSADLSKYFASYGSIDDINKVCKYCLSENADGQAYGIPQTCYASGMVYNKRVFKDAGITELPKTPDEFMEDLGKIKSNTKAIPLYTNYASKWAAGEWDDSIGVTTSGSDKYLNQTMLHTKDIFSDPGDGTGIYNVFKILYDAVRKGYTEEDFSATDWESSKTKMNKGEIGVMMLGSWAVSQIRRAGDNPDDIGYMAFPMTVEGRQYAAASSDQSYGINKNSENLEAARIWVKWLLEKSEYSYNEGGLAVAKDGKDADFYSDLTDNGVLIIPNEPAKSGEETRLNDLNQISLLNVGADDGTRGQQIIKSASSGSESFDDIMNDWNRKWDSAVSSVDE